MQTVGGPNPSMLTNRGLSLSGTLHMNGARGINQSSPFVANRVPTTKTHSIMVMQWAYILPSGGSIPSVSTRFELRTTTRARLTIDAQWRSGISLDS